MVAIATTTLLALAGLAIDVGMIYQHHAAMQTACDAAALAAVVQPRPQDTPGQDLMLAEARRFAGLNGFRDGAGGAQVSGAFPAGSPGDYQVTIKSLFAPMFVALVGVQPFTLTAAATARSLCQLPISINGGSNPGGSTAVTTLSAFGPFALHSYGDAYSTKFLNGGQANPSYTQNGYDFQITVPANYASLFNAHNLVVQVFDPDTGDNVGGATDGTDEIRAPNAAVKLPAGFKQLTTTQYTLIAVPTSFKDVTNQVQIAQATYSQDAGTSNVWVTPAGFNVDLNSYPGVTQFRLNVRTTGGSSENGYLLRAGPPSLAQTGDWLTNQADFNTQPQRDALDMIQASGFLPLNFNRSGSATANIKMGMLPAANGTAYRVHILKFDTDVGVTGITYSDSNGTTFPGVLAGQDTFREDVLTMPGTYPGGALTAHYSAGGADTSSWSMTYEGNSQGRPSVVKLVHAP